MMGAGGNPRDREDSNLRGIDRESVRCRSTGSGPEQKPKGIALAALVHHLIGIPGAMPHGFYEGALLALTAGRARKRTRPTRKATARRASKSLNNGPFWLFGAG